MSYGDKLFQRVDKDIADGKHVVRGSKEHLEILKNYNGEDRVINFYEAWDKAKKYLNSRKLYSLGYQTIDKYFDGGFDLGELIVVAGHTGNGKTLFSLNLTHNLVLNQQVPSLWFSFEMSTERLLERLQRMNKREGREDADPVMGYIPNKNKFSVQWVEDRVLECFAKGFNPKFVFIDHLDYLVTPYAGYNAQRHDLVGQTMRELKQLAVRNDVIVVLMVHTTKEDQHGAKKPNISMLKGSSFIGQESDAVFFVQRIIKSDRFGADNLSELHVLKNRRVGYTFFIDLVFENFRLFEQF